MKRSEIREHCPVIRYAPYGLLAILVFLFSVAVVGCVHAGELIATCENGIRLSAKLDSAILKQGVTGLLSIKNESGLTAKYSNRMAQLSALGMSVQRAYVDSVASQIVDQAAIEVQPGNQIVLRVYWPAPLAGNAVPEGFVLSCGPST